VAQPARDHRDRAGELLGARHAESLAHPATGERPAPRAGAGRSERRSVGLPAVRYGPPGR
jgi:hypothetical protein